jgi:hypothetical protein
MKKHNIFISWSGERSKLIAEAFREWIPMVIQAAKPWMSRADIDKGSRGLAEVAKALDDMKVGITCLTPENLTAPWILYEAGALSKTIGDATRLCTYLLGGLKNQDIEPPLGQFQHTSPEKEDTRHLIHTINKAVGEDDPLSEKTLDAIFDQFWPVLAKALKAFPEAPPEAVNSRPMEDMVAEILEFTRAETNRRQRQPFYYFASAEPSDVVTLSHRPSPTGGIEIYDSSGVFGSSQNAARNRVMHGLVVPAKPDEPDKK